MTTSAVAESQPQFNPAAYTSHYLRVHSGKLNTKLAGATGAMRKAIESDLKAISAELSARASGKSEEPKPQRKKATKRASTSTRRAKSGQGRRQKTAARAVRKPTEKQVRQAQYSRGAHAAWITKWRAAAEKLADDAMAMVGKMTARHRRAVADKLAKLGDHKLADVLFEYRSATPNLPKMKRPTPERVAAILTDNDWTDASGLLELLGAPAGTKMPSMQRPTASATPPAGTGLQYRTQRSGNVSQRVQFQFAGGREAIMEVSLPDGAQITSVSVIDPDQFATPKSRGGSRASASA